MFIANGFNDGAYYLAGYEIELLLKAKICKTLDIEDFFDFGSPGKTRIKNEQSVARPYKVHDLEQLIVLSGLFKIFSAEIATNPVFSAHWSIVSTWQESSRYTFGRSGTDAKDFITSIKEIASWIQKHL
jgi:hypothetical protein